VVPLARREQEILSDSFDVKEWLIKNVLRPNIMCIRARGQGLMVVRSVWKKELFTLTEIFQQFVSPEQEAVDEFIGLLNMPFVLQTRWSLHPSGADPNYCFAGNAADAGSQAGL